MVKPAERELQRQFLANQSYYFLTSHSVGVPSLYLMAVTF